MSNFNRGYQEAFGEYFDLCRRFSEAQEERDIETSKFLAERIMSKTFERLSDASKKKARTVFSLAIYDFEEAMTVRKESHIEETGELSLSMCFEIVEDMKNNRAAAA